ncbi:hypothetical protein [Thermincola potens]|uniref:hypothetical protein n=1 Tax=Thermincola potens TaxID=863643 RepID=UPI0002FBB940|nr:hypothetical protein [Thermincola potens]
MFKKPIIFLNVFLLMFLSFISFAKATSLPQDYFPPKEPPNSEEAVIIDDNNYLKNKVFDKNTKNFHGKLLRLHKFGLNNRMLVYGQPFGDFDFRTKQYRFIGENISGENISNVMFPPDGQLDGKLQEISWIKYPWQHIPLINHLDMKGEMIDKSQFDLQSKYLPNMDEGLKRYHGQYYDKNGKKETGQIIYMCSSPRHIILTGWGVCGITKTEEFGILPYPFLHVTNLTPLFPTFMSRA